MAYQRGKKANGAIVGPQEATFTGGGGSDTLNGTEDADQIFGLGGNDFLFGHGGDDEIDGGEGFDQLNGGAGNDRLEGGAGDGIDRMTGGTGDDIYIVTSADTVTELNGEGNDIVYYRSGFDLTENSYVELIAPLAGMSFPFGAQIRGNNLDNVIHGTAGNDVLDGRGGADTLTGFAGDDRYVIDNAGDVVVEEANGGSDTINTPFDVQLTETDNLEHIYSTSSTGRSLGGNSADNQITGTPQADLIVGAAGNDTLTGLGGGDSLNGGDGNDILDGGEGADLMVGGLGNDIYHVDNISDTVTEDVNEAGQGPSAGDRIITGINYTLAANQYIELLTAVDGSSPRTLTGNDIGQLISGTSVGDTLYGLGGDDVLRGNNGTDTTDGGFGDDSHYVAQDSDIVVERAGEGRDVVYTSVSYGLGGAAEVEVLSPDVLSSITPISLVGNSFGQLIYGNAGNNVIGGGGGTDVLLGLGGGDLYYIDTLGDHGGRAGQ